MGASTGPAVLPGAAVPPQNVVEITQVQFRLYFNHLFDRVVTILKTPDNQVDRKTEPEKVLVQKRFPQFKLTKILNICNKSLFLFTVLNLTPF